MPANPSNPHVSLRGFLPSNCAATAAFNSGTTACLVPSWPFNPPTLRSCRYPYPSASIQLVPSITEVATSDAGTTRVTVLPPLSGEAPARYVMTARPEQGTLDPLAVEVNSTSAFFTLAPSTPYVFTAVGVFPNGTETATSPAVRLSTLAGEAATSPQDGPVVTAVKLLTRDSISVEFAKPQNAPPTHNGYVVFAVAYPHGPTVEARGSASPVALDGLRPGIAYTTYCIAHTMMGTTLAAPGVAFTVPKSVANIPVIVRMSPGDGTLTLLGNQVEVDGGCSLTGYTIHCNMGLPSHLMSENAPHSSGAVWLSRVAHLTQGEPALHCSGGLLCSGRGRGPHKRPALPLLCGDTELQWPQPPLSRRARHPLKNCPTAGSARDPERRPIQHCSWQRQDQLAAAY